MIECSTRLYKAAFNIWNELLQPCRRLGVSPGRFLLSPHTVGRLLLFAAGLLLFPISRASRTQARWHWPALLWTTAVACQLSGSSREHYSPRISCSKRGSRCWRDGHGSFSAAQISFR